MTDLFDAEVEATTTTSLDLRRLQRQKRRAARRRMTLIVTAVALVLFGIGASVAYNFMGSFEGTESAAAADFEGPGQGTVQVVIEQGATGSDMATVLYDAGVIASTQAFIVEWNNNPDSSSIKPGYYFMHKEMKAEYALQALLDPSNRDVRTITVPEGKTLDYYAQAIVNLTGATQEEVEAAMADTSALGLPAEADGNLEGWLFPAKYEFDPGVTPTEVLQKMVLQTIKVLDKYGVDAAEREDILTVASLIEREAKLADDRPLIASVIYNRLAIDMKLELDSTVKYLSPSEGVFTSDEERAIDSEYNTYANTGLPPGPIAGPGEASIKAAVQPADTEYLFFVTVNLETGETKYATEYADHLKNVEELRAWVRENQTTTESSDG
ncbi:endolytic transglycosylase MltG [Demequina sp. SYSU T00039]|uniref:Endolytic murein transglycosylase n=1 Tax=Demequina lignilytica TaxID=3051663 RepID=A0AAW7M7N9_9MICO|nr:endolytic transglycosylase MltG [Demequina sp. SYSU T00039]MDN4486716.1 endolytic transglycosylase MltG [Demequina sp. SYSU T00039]